MMVVGTSIKSVMYELLNVTSYGMYIQINNKIIEIIATQVR